MPLPAPEPYRVVADMAFGLTKPERLIKTDPTMWAIHGELNRHGLTLARLPRYPAKPWCLYRAGVPLARGTLAFVCRHAVRLAQRQRE